MCVGENEGGDGSVGVVGDLGLNFVECLYMSVSWP